MHSLVGYVSRSRFTLSPSEDCAGPAISGKLLPFLEWLGATMACKPDDPAAALGLQDLTDRFCYFLNRFFLVSSERCLQDLDSIDRRIQIIFGQCPELLYEKAHLLFVQHGSPSGAHGIGPIVVLQAHLSAPFSPPFTAAAICS